MIFIVTYAEKPIEECHEFLELVTKLEFFFFHGRLQISPYVLMVITHLPLNHID